MINLKIILQFCMDYIDIIKLPNLNNITVSKSMMVSYS